SRTGMVHTRNPAVITYEYPFEVVMAAYEKRFPSCPEIPIVVGCEIVNEFKSKDGSVHVVERMCRLNIVAVKRLKIFKDLDCVIVNQKNSLDRIGRTLTIEAKNITYNDTVEGKERCRYY
ncbi:hypothetical protein PMAYCL1PPCAC_28692, partial [Pristionchus mayeri]